MTTTTTEAAPGTAARTFPDWPYVEPARPCFVCGKLMRRQRYCAIQRCPNCEVSEGPSQPKDTRQGVAWYGEWIDFIDHAVEHVPSPA